MTGSLPPGILLLAGALLLPLLRGRLLALGDAVGAVRRHERHPLPRRHRKAASERHLSVDAFSE